MSLVINPQKNISKTFYTIRENLPPTIFTQLCSGISGAPLGFLSFSSCSHQHPRPQLLVTAAWGYASGVLGRELWILWLSEIEGGLARYLERCGCVWAYCYLSQRVGEWLASLQGVCPECFTSICRAPSLISFAQHTCTSTSWPCRSRPKILAVIRVCSRWQAATSMLLQPAGGQQCEEAVKACQLSLLPCHFHKSEFSGLFPIWGMSQF